MVSLYKASKELLKNFQYICTVAIHSWEDIYSDTWARAAIEALQVCFC